MRAVALAVLSLPFLALCVAQTPVSAKYKNLPGVALYSHGYLLSWDSPGYTQLTVYGRDAKPAFSTPERMESSAVMWAVDSDGVVAGAYQASHLSEGRIDLFDQTGTLTNRINTGSYIPQQLVFAPDHTIWTASYDARRERDQDFNVLHHYARTGEELGQALRWSHVCRDLSHPVVGQNFWRPTALCCKRPHRLECNLAPWLSHLDRS